MHTTNLRKVGGSIMLAVPRRLLDILGLRPGAKVGIAVEAAGWLWSRTNGPAIRWTNCSRNAIRKARRTKEEREWLDSKPVGGELI